MGHIQFLKPFFEGKTEAFLIQEPYPIPIDEYFMKQYQETLLTMESMEADLETSSPFKIKDDNKARLEMIYLEHMAVLSSSYSQKEKEIHINSMLKNVIKTTEKLRLSEKIKDRLFHTLTRLFFKLNKDPNDFHDDFMERIHIKTEELKEDTKEFYEKYNSKIPIFLISELSNIKKILKNKKVDYLDDEDYYPLNFKKYFNILEEMDRNVTDQALPLLGIVFLSSYTEQIPKYGQGIVSHEIGHIVFDELEKYLSTQSEQDNNKIEKIKSCLANKHLETKNRPKDQYVMEDFADLIGALSTRSHESNFICAGLDQKNNQYIDLSFLNPDFENPHSSRLFRALHIHQVQHGSIPKSCQILIDVTQEVGPGFHDTCLELFEKPYEISTSNFPLWWEK